MNTNTTIREPSANVTKEAPCRQTRYPSPAPISYVRINELERPPFETIDRSLLIYGDAHQALDLLPDESVQTVVTSPPYWSLRDYEVEEQLGCDDALEDYVESIVKTFEKIRRVLRPDGTVWLNIGDAYTSGNRRYRAPDRKESRSCDESQAADSKRTEAERPDRCPVAISVRVSKSRMVASLGSDLAQAERTSGICSGPPHESARDIVSTIKKPKLLLRCWSRPGAERSEATHCLGYSNRAQKEWTSRRAPSDYANVASKQMRQHYHQARKRCPRSICGLGNNFTRCAKTRAKMGGC